MGKVYYIYNFRSWSTHKVVHLITIKQLGSVHFHSWGKSTAGTILL